MVYISLLLIINVVSIVIHCVVGESIGLRKHAGKRLHVTYKSVLADSAIHCNALCRRETSCRTSNHNKGTGECHFSEICHSDIEGNMVTDSNWDVYALNSKHYIDTPMNKYILVLLSKYSK